MFGANRKKFVEGGVESDYTDDSSLYYSQQSMFPPHRADKDVRPPSPFHCFCTVCLYWLFGHNLCSVLQFSLNEHRECFHYILLEDVCCPCVFCLQMLASSSTSSTGQLSQLGASLYGPQSTTHTHTLSRAQYSSVSVWSGTFQSPVCVHVSF